MPTTAGAIEGPTGSPRRQTGVGAGSAPPGHEQATVTLANRAAIVEGTAPDLSTENDALRQARLRASAIFLTATLGVFLLWRLVLGGDPLLPLRAATLCAMALAATVLSIPRRLPHRVLRVSELAVFGLMAAFLAVRQYHGMRRALALQDAVETATQVKSTLCGVMLLIFAYGMLIPNPWRRTARVTLTLALVPVATDLILLATHPSAFPFARHMMSVERAGETLLFSLVAAGLATYGAHVLGTLRREAFEARQFNQYRLGAQLGAGGMGEVYLAEHRLLKRPCALKLIRPGAASSPIALARFEREVRAAARLSHPAIVEIYDYGRTEDGTFYYVMEYLPGLNLDDLVTRHGPLPPGRVIYLLRQVSEGLAEAHAAGLIHRDLKPGNIVAARLGARHDVAKVLDFGLVKDLTEREPAALSREGAARGTPLFMPPEQVTGDRPPDHRSDLYALGATAYFLLTGRPPFEGEDAARVMIAHVRDPVIPPSRYRAELPDDLERVVLRCLAKDPGERDPDAEALGKALAACSAAGEWDAARAAEWWREVEHPGKVARHG